MLAIIVAAQLVSTKDSGIVTSLVEDLHEALSSPMHCV